MRTSPLFQVGEPAQRTASPRRRQAQGNADLARECSPREACLVSSVLNLRLHFQLTFPHPSFFWLLLIDHLLHRV